MAGGLQSAFQLVCLVPLRFPYRWVLGCFGGFIVGCKESSSEFGGWGQESKEFEVEKWEKQQLAGNHSHAMHLCLNTTCVPHKVAFESDSIRQCG